MKNILSTDGVKILNSILRYIPLKDKFYVADIYFRKIIIQKYPGEIIDDGLMMYGYSAGAEKERNETTNACNEVTSFLVDNDFADREADRKFGLTLTEKGKMLVQYNTLDGYLGFELRMKHAKENEQLTAQELMQSQIDYYNSSIKNQEKQEELNNSQLETNKISKVTNRYIAIFTAFAGSWYLYDLLYRIASEETITRHLNSLTPHYKNLKFGICFLITAVTILCIYVLLQKGRNTQKQTIKINKSETP